MASPRLTAVVCAYYPERLDNVMRIVTDLKSGSRPPDTIILLNNNETHPLPALAGVKVINSWNTECRGKYVAALLAQADYYLMTDDDITVGPETCAFLMQNAYPGIVTANRGIILHGGTFFNGEVVDADQIDEARMVDSICGCSVFMDHRALARTITAEEGLRSDWPVEGDDILAGFANRGRVTIFPMHGNQAWTWLSENGVAMNGVGGYYEMRDKFAHEALEHCERIDQERGL